ncbi:MULTISPECIES: MFS transporter [Anaeromyxobacter]|uniref:MFS transporter n=1 Tax=Anaeromyxobacter TaxID=161492 RepID=UPI001F58FFC7|nr:MULTISPECIES: MFS transporter [unclassified Anaeromyxobacter]
MATHPRLAAPALPEPAHRRGPPGRGAWWREPTRPQWLSFLAAWLGWVLDGFDFTIFLLAMRDIAKEFGVTYVATAGSITLTLLVRLAGGLAAGALADRVGRKLPLMISIAWFALCDGAVAFAPSFGWVLVFRTLFGFGMGAEWTAGAALAMESWPVRSRGIASGLLQGSWGVGFILAGVAHAWVVPAFGWRPLFLLAALPALLVIPIRLLVQESAEWRRAARERPRTSLAELAREGVLLRIAWASALLGMSFSVYYGLTGLWPALLQGELGRPPGDVAGLVTLFNVGMMVGAVGCGWLASRAGVVPALAIPLVLLLPALPLHVGLAPGLLWAGALLAGVLGAGTSGVTPMLFTLLFPPHVRARSMGVAYHVGALVAAVTPTLVAALHEDAGVPLSRAIAGVVAAAAALTLAVLFLRPRGALPDGGAPLPDDTAR